MSRVTKKTEEVVWVEDKGKVAEGCLRQTLSYWSTNRISSDSSEWISPHVGMGRDVQNKRKKEPPPGGGGRQQTYIRQLFS